MKKHVIFLILLCLYGQYSKSQTPINPPFYFDSIMNSNDPGYYYLNYLEQEIENSAASDTAESGKRSALVRELAFWGDRLPRGTGITNPKKAYVQALKTQVPITCNPLPGDFNGNWKNLEVRPQRQGQGIVYDLHVDELLPNTIWIGVQDAGLWKTINNGTDWTNVSDAFLPSGAGVESIAVNPLNTDEMMIGTNVTGNDSRDYVTWPYGAGVWHSLNRGNTWTLETGPAIDAYSNVTMLRYSPNLLSNGDQMIIGITYDYVASPKGQKILQKIGPNGQWADVTPILGMPPGNLAIANIEFIPDKPGTFYITTDAMAQPGGRVIEMAYNTTTGAISWVNDIYTETDMHRFNYGGFTTSDQTALVYDIAYAGNNKLYISAAGPGNSECRWNLLELDVVTGIKTNPLNPLIAMDCIPEQVRYFMNMAVHKNNPDVIYFGGLRPFKVCKINGQWQKLDVPCSNNYTNYHSDNRVVKIYSSVTNSSNPGGSDIVFWGNDGGISCTNGNNCLDLNGNNFYTTQTFDVGVSLIGNKRISSNMHNGIYNSTNTNQWQRPMIGDGFDAIYDQRSSSQNPIFLAHTNPTNSWATFTHANPGSNFTNLGFVPPSFGSFEPLRDMKHPHDFLGNKIYLANKNIWESTPNGYNPWIDVTASGALTNPFAIQNHCRLMAIAPSNSNRRYFAIRPRFASEYANAFYVLTNTNGWQNQTPLQISTPGQEKTPTDIAVDPKDENRFFLSLGTVEWGGNGNRVLKGDFNPNTNVITWNDMSNGLPIVPVISLVYQEGSDDIIYAGTDAGVYRWDKPQNCWVKFNDAIGGGKMPPVLINDLQIDYCKGTLVAASYGRGIWESDLYNFPGITNEITSNTTWSGEMHLKGNVIVRSGAVLEITGSAIGSPYNWTHTTNIFMPHNGTIFVEKGAKLIVYGSRITNGCNMWNGIQAFGRDVVGQWIGPNGKDPQHGIVHISKSTIENAENAVTNAGGNDAPYGNTGGILQLEGVHFHNNQRSVQFLKYENWNGVLNKDLSFIRQCHFTMDPSATNGFQTHISMWGVRGIQLLNNVFSNTRNLEASHERAIYTIDASYTLDGTTDPQTLLPYSNVLNFYKGVESNSFSWTQGNLYPIRINNSLFDGNEISLELGSMNYPIITSNKFRIGEKQTPYPTGSGWSYYSLGSLLDRVSNFIYCNNDHIKDFAKPAGVAVQYTAGTEIHASGENDQNINSNSYKELMIGTDCDYTCGDNANKTGIYFTCNRNSGNEAYDYIFQANPIIRPIQDAASNKAAGNTFTQNMPSVKHWFQAGGGNSPVLYHHSAASNEIPVNFNIGNLTPVLSFNGNEDCASEGKCGYTIPPKADNLEMIESDLNELQNKFSLAEFDYNGYKNVYAQLIDDGNTELTVDEIEQSNTTNAATLRTEMLALCPNISEEALYTLAEKNVLPQAHLLEILLLNPEATRSDKFLEYLQFEKPNPMPSYMMNLIRSSWSGSSSRAILESNIANSFGKMTSLRNEIILSYSMSPEFYDAETILTWIKKVPTLRNRYEVLEYLLSQKKYAEATSSLEALPLDFKLTEAEQDEYLVYTDLFNFKKTLLQHNIEINKLTPSKIQELHTIGDSPTPCLARNMARSALCFFYNICYPLEDRQLPIESQNRTSPKNDFDLNSKVVTVYPNPAKDYTVFYFKTTNNEKMSSLSIADITGKQVFKTTLQGEEGQYIWDTKIIESGNYIYMLTTSNGIKYTGKLTIQR